MKKLLAITASLLIFTSFTFDAGLFEGKIIYKYSFTDLTGNDVTEKFSANFGAEQRYFIDSKNYKAYDEKNNWVQLYNSSSNNYYYFNKDKTANKFDGSMQTSGKVVVTKLNLKDSIAGYECQALQIETDNATTVYYYTPLLRVDPKTYSKHVFGEWNKYMEASNGSLPLKFTVTFTKRGYVWTSVATEIVKMDFSNSDFEFPSDYTLQK